MDRAFNANKGDVGHDVWVGNGIPPRVVSDKDMRKLMRL
jgi:hypothetical protein